MLLQQLCEVHRGLTPALKIGGVILSGLAPGADHCVCFVDEHDYRLRRGLDLVDHRF